MVASGVHHVSINVTDTAAAIVFYEQLGFRVIERPDLGFPGAWMQIGDAGELHLLEIPPPEAKGQHFSVRVDDLDAAVATLATAGVEPDRIGGIEGVCRQAFLSDPSGNQVELTQPL